MTEAQLKESADNPSQDINAYAQFIRWTVTCSRKELSELDEYIQEKIRDLVFKFRKIAENAMADDAAVVPEKEGSSISAFGQDFSYSEATKELHRLTSALLSDTKLSGGGVATRKKIDQLSLELFKFSKSSEDQNTTYSAKMDIITANIKDIIMAFQFQDFVKQRLTHIDLILESLEENTEAFLKEFSTGEGVPEDKAQALLDKFFLTNVKETFIQGLDPEQAKNINVTIEADDDDIELF